MNGNVSLYNRRRDRQSAREAAKSIEVSSPLGAGLVTAPRINSRSPHKFTGALYDTRCHDKSVFELATATTDEGDEKLEH